LSLRLLLKKDQEDFNKKAQKIRVVFLQGITPSRLLKKYQEDFKSIGRPKRGATFKLYFLSYILSVISIKRNLQIVSLVEEKSIKIKKVRMLSRRFNHDP